jgi:hypothetical protein
VYQRHPIVGFHNVDNVLNGARRHQMHLIAGDLSQITGQKQNTTDTIVSLTCLKACDERVKPLKRRMTHELYKFQGKSGPKTKVIPNVRDVVAILCVLISGARTCPDAPSKRHQVGPACFKRRVIGAVQGRPLLERVALAQCVRGE